jgi:3-polyprenyl-4-hydroxybenzoate decarboxylase
MKQFEKDTKYSELIMDIKVALYNAKKQLKNLEKSVTAETIDQLNLNISQADAFLRDLEIQLDDFNENYD